MFKHISSVFLLLSLAVTAAAQDTIHVLHYTETTGFNHNTRQQSRQLFERICDSLTATTPYVWWLDHTDNSTVFDNLAQLQQYAVVIWSNTSGAGGLTATQRANYEQYVYGGGNYLGIHAASDTYRHGSSNGNNTGVWNFYAEYLAGCSVQENPNHTSSNHNSTLSHLAAHPILDGLPSPWNKTEEYYYWQNGYLNTSFTPLLQVAQTGPESYDAPRMMAHYKVHGWGSRSFYTALGHDASNFTSDTNFARLLKNALYWCASPAFPTGAPSLIIPNVTVFPNPFKETIVIDTGLPGSFPFAIYDLMSRKVYSGTTDQYSMHDLSHLRTGWYYLVLDHPQQQVTRQILKME